MHSATVSLPDTDLLAAARAGDGSGLARAFEGHRAALYARALRLLGNRTDAEDAVHEVFLVALTRLGELRDPAAFGGWLHAILRNHCLQQLRSRRREVLTADIPDDAVLECGMDERLERHRLRDWVWTVLAEMPEPLRATAMLRYFGSYNSYAEIADILAVPIGTVRSRLSEAKLRLAERLLCAAGLADGDQEAVRNERESYYRDAFAGLFEDRRDAFMRHYAAELELVFTAAGQAPRRFVGRRYLEEDIDGDVVHGTRHEVVRVLADPALSVVELQLHNSSEFPQRCPPGATLVLQPRGGRVCRAHLYLSPRPPRSED